MTSRLLAILAMIATFAPAHAEWQPDVTDGGQVRAHAMLEQIRDKEDAGFQALMDQSHAFVVFPKVSRTGLILGWASGRGVLIEEGLFVGYVRQRRLSLGFQFGRQSQGQLLLFRDSEATEEFKQGRLEFTPQASVQASKPRSVAEASFIPRVAVFSLTQDGLMIEAAVGATRFRFSPAKLPGNQQ